MNTGRLFALGTVLIVASASYGCPGKDSDFFAPVPIDASAVADLDAPIFSAIKPVPGATVLNSNVFSFTLSDPAGSNGGTPSGVDEASVSARTATGSTLTLIVTGLNYSGSLGSLSDGVVSLTLSAKDKAGNTRSSVVSFTLDRTPPVIALTTTPPPQMSSTDDTVSIDVAGTIADGAFGSGQMMVTQPGPDGVCGNADDNIWPKGNAGGQVSENTFDLTTSVKSNGTFAVGFYAYNPVPVGGASRTDIYCGTVAGLDSAKDENGTDKPNRSTFVWRTELTWSRLP
ncbi:MAG: hypothetical protein ABI556_15565 [Gemmatimonadales bacterium]